MSQSDPVSPPNPTAPLGLRWQDFFIIEGSGLRTTLAAVVPLVVGQILGKPEIGMLAAVGGLQLAFADFQCAKARTLLWATISSALLALLGALASQSSAPVSIALMFAVAFAMTMLGSFGAVVGNVGFVLTITYAFAQSAPVSWERGVEYMWTFALGGVWSSLLTLLLWKLRRSLGDLTVAVPTAFPANDYLVVESANCVEPSAKPGAWYEALLGHLALKSLVFKHAIRTAIATSVSVAICQFWHPPHGYWIILTTLVILKPDYASTKGRFAQRLLGTIAGGLLAMVPAAYIHNIAALDALLVFFGVLAFSHLPRNYGVYVLFLTPFVVLISTIAVPTDAAAALARIGETILGGLLAFAVAFFLRLPRRFTTARA